MTADDDLALRIIRLESQLLAANQLAEQRRQAIAHMSEGILRDSAAHELRVYSLREALHVALEALQRARAGERNVSLYCGQAIERVREVLSYE